MSKSSDFISGGGVKPPKPAANNLMGLINAETLRADFLPMNISASGELIQFTSTTLEHFDEGAVSIWGPVAYTSILAGSVVAAHYWDKVEDRLYVLVNNAGGFTTQLAFLNTLTGAITTLGGTFASVELDAASKPSGVSMTRAVQGTGNLLVSATNATGMSSLEIPPAGGSQTNVVSNLLLGGVSANANAAYKVDSDLFIGSISAPGEQGNYTFNVADNFNNVCFMSMASSLRQVLRAQVRNSDGSVLGIQTATTNADIAGLIREWGDDVAIYREGTLFERSGPALYDKADFNRWATDVAKANGVKAQ